MGSGWNSATAQIARWCGAGEGCALLSSPHPVPSEIDFAVRRKSLTLGFPVSIGALTSALP
jgi:hypothetical protein